MLAREIQTLEVMQSECYHLTKCVGDKRDFAELVRNELALQQIDCWLAHTASKVYIAHRRDKSFFLPVYFSACQKVRQRLYDAR